METSMNLTINNFEFTRLAEVWGCLSQVDPREACKQKLAVSIRGHEVVGFHGFPWIRGMKKIKNGDDMGI